MVSHELIHSMKNIQEGMLIKIKFSKKIDELNWSYLFHVLKYFHFSNEWNEWVVSLFSSSFFSIMTIESPFSIFNSPWGIRKGDPLSPFLFVLVVEGLVWCLHVGMLKGKIKGICLHTHMVPITHQQFVDDKILMGSSTIREMQSIKRILDDLMLALGTMINLSKS